MKPGHPSSRVRPHAASRVYDSPQTTPPHTHIPGEQGLVLGLEDLECLLALLLPGAVATC